MMSGQQRPSVSPVLQTAPGAATLNCSSNLLTVDESVRRARANSDPVVHYNLSNLPEITVTGEDGDDSLDGEDAELDKFLVPPSPRKRANTCPEDMFRQRKGRPPTPPPMDITKGPKRYSFNFNTKDVNGISFAHHKLSKVTQELDEEEEEEEEENASASCSQTAHSVSLHQHSHVKYPDFTRRHSQPPPSPFTDSKSHSSAFSITPHGKTLSNAFQGLSLTEQDNLSSSRQSQNNGEINTTIDAASKSTDVTTCSSGTWLNKDSSHEKVDNPRLQAC